MDHAVTLPGGQILAYAEAGNPAGRPVVLIHGYTDSSLTWTPLLPFLPQDLRWILVDLRGHGASSAPADGYGRLDFALDITRLLDRLDIAVVDLVGHSLGSIVAQTLAEFWPTRVRRVVLIGSTGGRPAGAGAPPAFDFAKAIRALEEPLLADSPFMVEWWSSPTPVDVEFLRRGRRLAAAMPLRVWLAILEESLSEEIAFADLQSSLPWLRAPTLLLWGADDAIMTADLRATLCAALPAANVRIYAGLGHNPFWEDPRRVAADIAAFLLGIEPDVRLEGEAAVGR